MKILGILTIIACIFLASCATHTATQEQPSQRRAVDVWKGKHISEVIQKWGQPQQVIENRTSGRIYVWQLLRPVQRDFSKRRYSLVPGEAQLRSGMQRTIKFYVDSDGMIYQWSASPDRDDVSH